MSAKRRYKFASCEREMDVPKGTPSAVVKGEKEDMVEERAEGEEGGWVRVR